MLSYTVVTGSLSVHVFATLQRSRTMSIRSYRRALLSLTSLALMLVLSGLFRPQAVLADSRPAPLSGSDGVTINPDGGGPGTNTGLRIDVYNVQYQVFRDGMYQVYDEDVDSYTDWLLWMPNPDPTEYGGYVIEMLAESELDTPDFTSPNDYCYWSDTGGSCFTDNTEPAHVLETPATLGANKWRATVTMTGNDLYTLKLVYTYTAPNNYFDLEATVTRKSGNTFIPDEMHLYWVADLTLNEADDGPTTTATFEGRPTYGQYSPADQNDAFSGFTVVDGFEPDSVYLGYYECAGNAYVASAVTDGVGYSGCTGQGPGNKAKPAYGEPFSVSLDDYETDFIAADESLDAGMGAHWELNPTKSSWKVKIRPIYSDYSWFASNVTLPGASKPTTACTTPPTMRLVPDPLTIAPGETQTLWIEVVNSCRDKPFSGGDLLVSFDNGLSATAEGWLNLGQRIALQGLSLNPGELRSWPLFFTAAADATLPQNLVAEVYYAGAVAGRIDHPVAGLPAVAVAAPAPVVEAAPVAPVVPAEPAALPVALPNTSNGAEVPVVLFGLIGAAAAVVGLGLRRRRA
jgi:hypothetical protein